ncbi:MAG: class I SAM-dependent methyltransferase, partial [Candidatus Spechtbacterales bacterium]
YNPRKSILIGKQFRNIVEVKGKSVLDLGCGLGFFALLAKRLGAEYVLGVDNSKKMIELARAKAKKVGHVIDYKASDISDLDAKRKFDIVTAGFVFNYASNITDLRKYLLAASKHLKSGGKLFGVLCNPDNPLRDTKILYRVVSMSGGRLKDGTKLRCEFYDGNGDFLCYDYKFLWSKKTAENILKQLGFHKIKWIDIKNINNRRLKVPRLPSSNILLYATKL